MADVAKERDIWVHSFRLPADTNATIKMEVGNEDCLHIEFEYNKSKCVFSYPTASPYHPLLPPSLPVPSSSISARSFTLYPSSFPPSHSLTSRPDTTSKTSSSARSTSCSCG